MFSIVIFLPLSLPPPPRNNEKIQILLGCQNDLSELVANESGSVNVTVSVSKKRSVRPAEDWQSSLSSSNFDQQRESGGRGAVEAWAAGIVSRVCVCVWGELSVELYL